jgi:hypothetical protein
MQCSTEPFKYINKTTITCLKLHQSPLVAVIAVIRCSVFKPYTFLEFNHSPPASLHVNKGFTPSTATLLRTNYNLAASFFINTNGNSYDEKLKVHRY